MPDLAKMLGDVYDAPATTVTDVAYRPASPDGRPGPDWADDDRLDRAFAGWTPGPAADAPAAERKLFSGADEAPAPLADDLAAALSEAVLAEQTDAAHPTEEAVDDEPAPVVERPMTATAFGGLATEMPRPAAPVPVPVEVPEEDPVPPVEDTAVEPEAEPEPLHRVSGSWQRADDDILPGGGKAKLSLRLRRR